MPMTLLLSLTQSSLPHLIGDSDDIEKVAVLADAGLVTASFVAWRDPSQKRVATVHSLTERGGRTLQRLSQTQGFACTSPSTRMGNHTLTQHAA